VIEKIKKTYAERTFGIPFMADKKLLPVLLARHSMKKGMKANQSINKKRVQ
jgi:hypothetical protein